VVRQWYRANVGSWKVPLTWSSHSVVPPSFCLHPYTDIHKHTHTVYTYIAPILTWIFTSTQQRKHPPKTHRHMDWLQTGQTRHGALTYERVWVSAPALCWSTGTLRPTHQKKKHKLSVKKLHLHWHEWLHLHNHETPFQKEKKNTHSLATQRSLCFKNVSVFESKRPRTEEAEERLTNPHKGG